MQKLVSNRHKYIIYSPAGPVGDKMKKLFYSVHRDETDSKSEEDLKKYFGYVAGQDYSDYRKVMILEDPAQRLVDRFLSSFVPTAKRLLNELDKKSEIELKGRKVAQLVMTVSKNSGKPVQEITLLDFIRHFRPHKKWGIHFNIQTDGLSELDQTNMRVFMWTEMAEGMKEFYREVLGHREDLLENVENYFERAKETVPAVKSQAIVRLTRTPLNKISAKFGTHDYLTDQVVGRARQIYSQDWGVKSASQPVASALNEKIVYQKESQVKRSRAKIGDKNSSMDYFKAYLVSNLRNFKDAILPSRSNLERNLIDKQHHVIMGWSPKAGCTLAVKMFFEQIGLLKFALDFHPWIHEYRAIYSKENPVFLEDLKSPNYKKFKVVRNPFNRCVSSYAHAMITGYANWEIKNSLHVVDPQNISFEEFVRFLESENLATCNPHHGYQNLIRIGEGQEFKYDLIVRLEEIEALLPSLNQFLLTTYRLNSEITQSKHHTKKIEHSIDRAWDKPFEFISERGKELRIPNYCDFLSENLVDRIGKLYKIDIESYGY